MLFGWLQARLLHWAMHVPTAASFSMQSVVGVQDQGFPVQGMNYVKDSICDDGAWDCDQELVDKKMALAQLHEDLLKASHRPREAVGGEV